MLADPQSLKFGAATAISLPRTGSGVNTGQFKAADGTATITVSHQVGKRTRRQARVDHAKIAADPLTSANTRYSMSVYTVIDVPPVGYTVAEAQEVVAAQIALLNSAGFLQKLLGGES